MRVIVPQSLAIDSTNVAASALPEWSAGSTYSTGQQVKYTASQPVPHHEFESLQDSNTGHTPTIGGDAYWLDLGATNQHRMFDGFNNSRTAGGSLIDVTVTPPGRGEYIALLGLRNAQSITVTQTVGGAEVSASTHEMGASYLPVGWWAFLFGELYYRRSLIIPLPGTYYQPNIRVEMAGVDVECGQCLVGSGYWIGDTEWGAKPQVKSYSTFEKNDFGVTEYVSRQNVRDGEYAAAIDTREFDRVYALMESIIDSLVVLDANNSGSDLDSLRAYGKIIDFSPGLRYEKTMFDISIEGLE